MPEIWKRMRNVVPLQSIREMLCECGLRLSIARASSALRSPCTTLVIVNHERHKAGCRPPGAVGRNDSNTMKNTHNYGKDFV